MDALVAYLPFALSAVCAAWLAIVGLLRWSPAWWAIVAVACLLVSMQSLDRVLSDQRLQAEQVRLLTELGKVVTASTEDMPAPVIAATGAISIVEPGDGAEVFSQAEVAVRWQGEGLPWVVVNPAGSGNFWVQPALEHEGGGLWRGKIYLGEPGNGQGGARYFLAAVSGVSGNVKVGAVFSDWPMGAAASEVVTLIRR